METAPVEADCPLKFLVARKHILCSNSIVLEVASYNYLLLSSLIADSENYVQCSVEKLQDQITVQNSL